MVVCKVKVLEELVLDGLKEAVTPFGNPETVRATEFLRFAPPDTVRVALTALPLVTVNAPEELEIVNLPDSAPTRSLINGWPTGEPQPVARSYPATALKPFDPVRMSWKSDE